MITLITCTFSELRYYLLLALALALAHFSSRCRLSTPATSPTAVRCRWLLRKVRGIEGCGLGSIALQEHLVDVLVAAFVCVLLLLLLLRLCRLLVQLKLHQLTCRRLCRLGLAVKKGLLLKLCHLLCLQLLLCKLPLCHG